jgi:hypothetical protein
MAFPRHLYFVYPMAGALGTIMLVGLWEDAAPDSRAWWAAALVSAAVGTCIGWLNGVAKDADGEGDAKVKIGPAILAGAATIPVMGYLRPSVSAEMVLGLVGIFLAGAFMGFVLGALRRLSSARRTSSRVGS